MSVLTTLLGLAKATVADDPRRYLTNDLAKTLDRLDQLAYGARNLLVNGGFEVWQRGNGPFTVSGAFTADRWAINLVGTDTVSVSKDTTNQDAASVACAACTFTRGTGTDSALFQSIEDNVQLREKTITLSVRMKTSTASAVRIAVQDNVATGYSAFHTGGGGYETLTATVTVGAAATAVRALVLLDASCTAHIDNAMLVLGSVAAPYAPLTPAEEWARVQRYYEVHGSVNGMPVVTGVATATSQSFTTNVFYPVRMTTTPTATKVGTWTVSNSGQPFVNRVTQDGYNLNASAVAAGFMAAVPDNAGNVITIEANP